METKKPAQTFHEGRVHGAAWLNHRTRKDGTHFASWELTLERRYKDQAGEWQSTSRFDLKDIVNVVKVAEQAQAFIESAQPADAKAKAKAA